MQTQTARWQDLTCPAEVYHTGGATNNTQSHPSTPGCCRAAAEVSIARLQWEYDCIAYLIHPFGMVDSGQVSFCVFAAGPLRSCPAAAEEASYHAGVRKGSSERWCVLLPQYPLLRALAMAGVPGFDRALYWKTGIGLSVIITWGVEITNPHSFPHASEQRGDHSLRELWEFFFVDPTSRNFSSF